MSEAQHPKHAETPIVMTSSTTEPPSRRDFLFTGAAGAAFSLGSLLSLARQAQAAQTRPADSCAIADQLFGIQNVTCFGAKGDGVTDDWAAIQDAVNALPGEPTQRLPSGGIVYLPPGTYRITQPIKVHTNGVHIVGSGKTSTLINNASNPTAPAISLAGPPDFISYGSVQGLGILGGGGGISMSAVSDWLFDDILILDTEGHGIEITTQCITCEFRRVHVGRVRNYNGFHVGAPCVALWFINCRSVQNADGAGIYTVPLVGAAEHGSLSVIGGTYESNQYGIYLNSVRGVVINGTYFEASRVADIRFGTPDPNSTPPVLPGSDVRGAVIQGIYANGEEPMTKARAEAFVDLAFARNIGIMNCYSTRHQVGFKLSLAGTITFGPDIVLIANEIADDQQSDEGALLATQLPNLMNFAEIPDPLRPGPNQAQLYARENAGRTELVVQFPSGAVKVLATEA